MNRLVFLGLIVLLSLVGTVLQAAQVQYYPLPAGAGPHDVAPAADGRGWYTAQRQGALGRLDPQSGVTEQVPLSPGSAPHGVIVDGQGAAWVTDSGLNAIVRVDGRAGRCPATTHGPTRCMSMSGIRSG